jgi:phosphatidylglycerophosphate synthase
MPASLIVFLCALGALLLSMPVYALLGARRDDDAARKGTQFALGGGNFLVHWFMWVLRPVEALVLRSGLSPDVFNFAGLFFGLASGAFIATGRLEAGGWAIAAGGVCDIFDGRIARARGLASRYGQFIDSTLDRFVEVFALLGFVVYLGRLAGGALVAAAALAGSLLVSYARARGESVGVLCKEGLMQRAERLVLTCLVALTDGWIAARFGLVPGTASLWVLALIAVGTFATAAHRTVWISRRLLEAERAR